jgi:hypothetical protein
LTEMSDNLDAFASSWVDLLPVRGQRLHWGQCHASSCTSDHGGFGSQRAGCPNRHSHRRAAPACQDRQSAASDRRVRLDCQYSCEPAIEVVGREGRNLGKRQRENRFQAYEGVSVALRSTSVRKASKEQDQFPLNDYATTRRLCVGSSVSLLPALGSHTS